jgi:hypothetical protein
MKKAKKKPTITRFDSVETTLNMACAAPFMPKWKKSETGGRQFTPKHEQWRTLQREILQSEALDNYWTNKSFRVALGHLNYITNNMAIHGINHLKEEQWEGAARDIGCYCCYVDSRDHSGFLLLKNIVEKIKELGGLWVKYWPNQVDDILVSLSVVIRCQEIYLNSQNEPEPEEKEKKDEPAPLPAEG